MLNFVNLTAKLKLKILILLRQLGTHCSADMARIINGNIMFTKTQNNTTTGLLVLDQMRLFSESPL